MLLLFVHAYSLGGARTLESRRLQRPAHHARAARTNGQRTMLYMSVSLAIVAGGLLLCYLLVGVGHVEARRSTLFWP
jgi:hypothetical protein